MADSIRSLGCCGDDLKEGVELQDLGIDSIEIVELATMAWKRCGLGPRALDVRDVQTMGQLVNRLHDGLPEDPAAPEEA